MYRSDCIIIYQSFDKRCEQLVVCNLYKYEQWIEELRVGQDVRDVTLSCSGIPFQDQRESGFIPPDAGDSALSWWPSAETALSEETPAASGSPTSPSAGTPLSLHHGPTSPLAQSSFLLLAGVGTAE